MEHVNERRHRNVSTVGEAPEGSCRIDADTDIIVLEQLHKCGQDCRFLAHSYECLRCPISNRRVHSAKSLHKLWKRTLGHGTKLADAHGRPPTYKFVFILK